MSGIACYSTGLFSCEDAMPKQKTHKGLAKRVKVTASGKVVRRRAFRGHLMSGKSGARKRRLRRAVLASWSDTRRTLEVLVGR
jgi:large subunit ribosomal protein L35